MLETVAVVGLASVYVWYVVALSTIGDRPFGRLRDRWPMLIGCCWCSSLYITAGILLATGNYDPLTHAASAGMAGLLGTLAS